MDVVAVHWDIGSAYDLFVSLHVLNEPERFGLRASWAAGVRSRLTAEQRKVLEDSNLLFHVPTQWIYHLPAPKDGQTALWSLSRLSAGDRLPALALNEETQPQVKEVLCQVLEDREWSDKQLDQLRLAGKNSSPRQKDWALILERWAHAREFGESYLEALQAYYQVFFAEEERRILPALQSALERSQAMASEKDLPALLEQLSQGVRFSSLRHSREVVFAPSYWSTPLVFYTQLAAEKLLFLFGARPEGDSLIPGESVPDALLRTLKALADPTRLMILRYLAGQPHTPAQLSRKLRLRAPTVIHHLNNLRLAGLIFVMVEESGERRYASRLESIESAMQQLQEYMEQENQPTRSSA